MLNILSIHLQAILKEENLYRDYSIPVGKDLFGKRVITTSNGRIGIPGKISHYAFSSK